ncbi:TetR/AcrR family transcriptional regulator [Acidihalobacter prosperus]|uniref:TetR family transcriptional regulator n=1 Tax=Acidihalobacter prosperus TaxID=160660 RepID=A0A1A6C6B0_9GAMM|nr:TetR/AcrR family transcriptional regulator [Acidihalobacter prosperus]OBS10065.1 TetR family transcriptional regulator [Acidihalobacter prosperus]
MTRDKHIPAKERILLAAHDLFYRQGIRATGIDRIIADSGVTKVTLYRHFPSKNELVRAFLDYRHTRWMEWFKSTIKRHGQNIDALVPTLMDWFQGEDFRGCAFINTVGELATDFPEVVDLARRHKEAMTAAIFDLLPAMHNRDLIAHALGIAVDGAIVRVQYGQRPEDTANALTEIIRALTPERPSAK